MPPGNFIGAVYLKWGGGQLLVNDFFPELFAIGRVLETFSATLFIRDDVSLLQLQFETQEAS